MKIFYSPQMVYQPKLPSPSPRKPEYVIERWQAEFPSHQVELMPFRPVIRTDLCRAHDPTYVHGVCDGRVSNGFGQKSVAYAQSTLWTVGSFVSAMQYAMDHRTVTCSPTSGFHHAGYAKGGGFCTFNGLMVAAQQALDRLPDDKNVLILDCDYHYGDGTADIVQRLDNPRLVHITAGQYFRGPEQVSDFLHWLQMVLEVQLPQAGVVLYQAGADQHVQDPLGGLLTTDEMLTRDEIVFWSAQKESVPIVWNLAGGYQTPIDKVLDLHSNTLSAALRYESRQRKGSKFQLMARRQVLAPVSPQVSGG